MKSNVLNKLFKSSFSKSIFVLSGGTAISQLIPIASLPIIARVYTPLEIGEYSLYYTLIGFCLVVVFLKYNDAIVLPSKKHESQALALVYLSFALLIIFSTGLFLLSKTLSADLIKSINLANDTATFFTFAPLTLFCAGLFALNVSYLVRSQSFKLLSLAKILYTVIFASLQIVLGFSGLGTIGMIAANISAYLLVSILILKRKTLKIFLAAKRLSPKRILYIAKKYKDFPKIDLPTTLLNVSTNQIPIMFVSWKYGVEFYGYYMLTYKVLMAPCGLISRSVLDVFKTSAISQYTSTGHCMKLWKKVFFRLLSLGIIPFLVVLLFSPLIFEFVFGVDWIEAGRIGQIFAIPFFLRFLVNPLSYTFYIANKQKYNLMFNVFYLLLVLLSLVVSSFFESPNSFFIGLAFAQTFNYSLYLVISYKLSMGSQSGSAYGI